jgi:hypothetical protein
MGQVSQRLRPRRLVVPERYLGVQYTFTDWGASKCTRFAFGAHVHQASTAIHFGHLSNSSMVFASMGQAVSAFHLLMPCSSLRIL